MQVSFPSDLARGVCACVLNMHQSLPRLSYRSSKCHSITTITKSVIFPPATHPIRYPLHPTRSDSNICIKTPSTNLISKSIPSTVRVTCSIFVRGRLCHPVCDINRAKIPIPIRECICVRATPGAHRTSPPSPSWERRGAHWSYSLATSCLILNCDRHVPFPCLPFPFSLPFPSLPFPPLFTHAPSTRSRRYISICVLWISDHACQYQHLTPHFIMMDRHQYGASQLTTSGWMIPQNTTQKKRFPSTSPALVVGATASVPGASPALVLGMK